ncbi:uncharacterized protein LOC123676290 isoform X4 [Harmonia axyridis]|nr:uncharacterized protein LOC123676290 isoform X4 [Harmonia axyridis]
MKWVTSFRTTGNIMAKKPPGATRTVRTPENIERVRTAMITSPGRSARRHAPSLNMGRESVRKILKLDLKKLPEIVEPSMKKIKLSSVDVESPPPEVKIEMDENMPGPSDESYTDTFESIVKTEPGLQEVKPQPDITASYNTKSDEVEDAEDACGYFGKYVAAELRSLPLKQRTLIKQEIQNCITHAVVGHISNLGDSESMKEENGSLSASSSNS